MFNSLFSRKSARADGLANDAPSAPKFKGNKRLPRESFKKYQKRRAEENRKMKRYLKGCPVWISAVLDTRKESKTFGKKLPVKGTYVNPIKAKAKGLE